MDLEMQKQNLPKDNWIERFYEFLQGQEFLAAVKNAQ